MATKKIELLLNRTIENLGLVGDAWLRSQLLADARFR
jgi:hypothetical protein